MKKAGLGIVAVLGMCLCGGIANACDESSPTPRPVRTSAPITSAPVVPLTTPTPTTAAPAMTTSPTPHRTTASPKPKPTTAKPKPKPKPTTKAPSNVYYANCAAVRAAGAAPLYRGEPGYSRKLDRDGDGVACER